MALQSVSYACVEWRDCTTQSIGRDLTIAFESYLMHVCVVACPDGTGLPVQQQCKCTGFLLLTNDNPSRCVQSRDCTHTIDGRELTNRHNSIRELLMHMCVCCCLPKLAQGYLYSNSAKALDFGYSHKWLSNPYRMLVLNGGIARHNR